MGRNRAGRLSLTLAAAGFVAVAGASAEGAHQGQFSDWTLYRGEFAAPSGLPSE